MSFPEFYQRIPAIRLQDPLARLLGASKDGVIEYGYADCVKLAGHSCPTVAGAYLCVWHALGALYGDELPQRGNIAVALANPATEGVSGVMASIATLITGAAGEGGFKGLGGRHQRNGLLGFGMRMAGQMRFTRRDTGATVETLYQPQHVPGDPAIATLLPLALSGHDAEAERAFARLWQERVERLLTSHFHDTTLVRITLSSA